MKRLLLLLTFILIGNTFYAQGTKSNTDTGKSKDSQKFDIKIYPNPVTTSISLSSNADNLVKKILIFNLVGREMKRFDFVAGEKYYMGDLPKGMYLVQLLGSKNQVLRTKRVTKR